MPIKSHRIRLIRSEEVLGCNLTGVVATSGLDVVGAAGGVFANQLSWSQ